MEGILDGFFENANADQIALMPKEVQTALKKYGKYSKIPKAERARMAGAMMAHMQGMGLSAGQQAADALAGGGLPPVPVAPAAPAAPPKPSADGWFQRHNLAPPSFDGKHARIDQLIAFGLAEAKKNVPDAALTRIDISGVYPDGHADFNLPSFASPHSDITLRFISPAHAKRDPSLPRGVEGGYNKCSFYIVIGPSGGEIYDTSDKGLCTTPPIPAPRCSVAAVWKKALAKRKDLGDAVAAFDYNKWSNGVGWDFTIRDGSDTLFNDTFPDDCH